MIINHLDVIVVYAKRNKVNQLIKLGQWSYNDIEKKEAIKNVKNDGVR